MQVQPPSPLLELLSVSKRVAAPLDVASQICNRLGLRWRWPTVDGFDDVDLVINQGEAVGIAGEPRCGKTTLGRVAIGRIRMSCGSRRWKGAPIDALPARVARELRLRMQMIESDPQATLDARLRVIDIVGGAAIRHRIIRRHQQIEYVGLQLNRVGVDPTLMRRFHHQFSASQRTRVGIARALALKPELLVCDDPVAWLGPSEGARILNLFSDLKARGGLSFLFIGDDPGVLRQICDRVLIMHRGRIVERGPARDVLDQPRHPYTRALLERFAAPNAGFDALPGDDAPSPFTAPAGCRFHPQCPQALACCRVEAPPLVASADGRASACWLNVP